MNEEKEPNNYYLCDQCQISYHIDNLSHFEAGFYCSKCLVPRFYQYYDKKPVDMNDEILAQVFALIYTNKSFKYQVETLVDKFAMLTDNQFKDLRKQFFLYYHKPPNNNSIDDVIAEVFALIQLEQHFKEQLMPLIAKFGGIINE
jgi:hypothetical protein